MQKPQLLLSNTTNFFSGKIETTFRNAKKFGFSGLELIPYRWTTPGQVLALEQKYQIQVHGIHLPIWWDEPLLQVLRERIGIADKFFSLIWQIYLGSASESPGLGLVESLAKQGRYPYLLIHSNVAARMGNVLSDFAKHYHVVVENIPYHARHDRFLWDPVLIKNTLRQLSPKTDIVFDGGHFDQTRQAKPELDLLQVYKQAAPEVIHISYNSRFIHLLPNAQEQKDLEAMLRIHQPKYITVETNPLVSVRKAKRMIEEIVNSIK